MAQIKLTKEKLRLLLRFSLAVLLLGVIAFAVYTYFLKQPTNDRNWDVEFVRLPKITIADNVVTVADLRDYPSLPQDHQPFAYTARSIPVDSITNVWFVVEPFGKFAGIAHTYFVFDSSVTEPTVVSVEARRPKTEKWSPYQGMLNHYELMYMWTTERDETGRRVLVQHNKLSMYPLRISQSQAQHLFVQLAERTHSLETKPRFYNTLFNNCTNELARAVNNLKPGTIPFNRALLFPGYSDEVLYDLGFIPHDRPFDQIKNRYAITEIVKRIDLQESFSDQLRSKL